MIYNDNTTTIVFIFLIVTIQLMTGPQVASASLGGPVYLSLFTNALFYVRIVVKEKKKK